jgi:hypothetical protein
MRLKKWAPILTWYILVNDGWTFVLESDDTCACTRKHSLSCISAKPWHTCTEYRASSFCFFFLTDKPVNGHVPPSLLHSFIVPGYFFRSNLDYNKHIDINCGLSRQLIYAGTLLVYYGLAFLLSLFILCTLSIACSLCYTCYCWQQKYIAQ